MEYECDPRHAEIIIRELASEIQKGPKITSPGVKQKSPDNDDDDPFLNPAMATRYRRLVARANFIALDRCDILFSTKELTRGMSNPRSIPWKALIRMGK